MEPVELMENTLRNISPYIDHISRKDEFIFTPEFGNAKTKPLQFFPKFDFRKVWAKRDLSKENKRVIFRYLELIYINSSLALNRNRDKVNELVEAIKMEQEIAKEAEENPNAFGDADQAGGNSSANPLDFNSIFGDDNIIMDLVKDLKNELNLQDLFGEIMSSGTVAGRNDARSSGAGAGPGIPGLPQLQPGQNPMAMIQAMASNPQMQEVMKNIAGKLESKIKEKGITQEDLVKSTESIKNNLTNQVSKMPGGSHLKKMLNNLDFDTMFKQMSAGMGEAGGVAGDAARADILEGLFKGGSDNQIPPDLQEMLRQMQNGQGQGSSERTPGSVAQISHDDINHRNQVVSSSSEKTSSEDELSLD